MIMPVYNEAGVIEEVVRGFYDKVVTKMPGMKFIIAEDGSTDGTKDLLHRLNKEIPFVLISTDERKGYSKAFRDILRLAETEFVFFSDSDGQHDPEDFFKLLQLIENHDIVSGYKLIRRDPFHRIVISNVYNFLIFLLFGLKMKDIDSGFKLIKKKVIEDVLKDPLVFSYCVMSEFILKAHFLGYAVLEVPVRHYARKHGRTAIFEPSKLPLIILRLIKGLFAIRFNHRKRR